MASAPDQPTLARNRDLVGHERWPYVRWAVLETNGRLSFVGKSRS